MSVLSSGCPGSSARGGPRGLPRGLSVELVGDKRTAQPTAAEPAAAAASLRSEKIVLGSDMKGEKKNHVIRIRLDAEESNPTTGRFKVHTHLLRRPQLEQWQ